jgi:AAA domain/Bifunctional DNA primase/polymerase, N-terminal
MLGSPLHLEALRYAQDGIPVFPCVPDGTYEKNGKPSKRPACKNGHLDATVDPEQIDAWWKIEDYNLGMCPNDAGWCVVDIDPGGLENWKNLCLQHGDQKTARVRTPRQGFHFYYRGSLPPTSGKLAPGIDTRGIGSYVLVPPSVVGGTPYKWEGNDETLELPAWIREAVAQRSEPVLAANSGDLDQPADIARAKSILDAYVSSGDVAREGSGGDHRTYRLAGEIISLGTTPETALDLIEEIWNPHCLPPWPHDELRAKVNNASAYMQNEPGAYAVVSPQEAFGPALDKLKAQAASEGIRRSKFYPYSLAELPAALAEPAWLLPELIPARGIVQIIGKQKSFKTFLTLDMALGLASGTVTFGYTPTPCAIVYAVGENASAFGLRHIPAWKIARQQDGDWPLYVVPAVPKAIFAEEANELIEQIVKRGIKPQAVVIDTATRAMRGLDENSAKDMGMFSQTCDNIRDALDCAVIVIRHMGKDSGRGGRGSNALDGDFDTTLEVIRHEKSTAVALYVRDQRNADERADPFTFEGRQLAGSLVFFPTTLAQHMQYTQAENLFASKKVGAALIALGAVGRDKAVVTPVLAAKMIVPDAAENAEQRQATIGRACKNLNSLAAKSLQGYCEFGGRDRFWFMPVD